MSMDFNLLDEPWLPIRFLDGHTGSLGLLEAFARSHEIVGIAETAPTSLVAEYRLLLAITHRALVEAQGTWTDDDRLRWYRDGLPVAMVQRYLERWRERFWLFHPEHPFLQVAALSTAEETRDKRKPWTQIALASANGNSPVVFDHACDGDPVEISPPAALTTLLGFLQFTPGGLVKALRDSDKAGALVNTAAVIPVGATLAQTLCLALHPAPRVHGDPDLPAWERQAPGIAELRGEPVLATGPNDRYTRQSRAVLLLREDGGSIRWLRFAAGLALGEDPNAPDPMASFRVGSNGLVRLTFTAGRAVWRDLPTLLPNSGRGSQPAAVLNHALALHSLISFDVSYQPLLVAGIASDQAKLLRWRVEQFVLPAALLAEPEKAVGLSQRIDTAEVLFRDLRRLMTGLLADTLPDPGSKDTRARAASLLEAGPLASTYFAFAERALPELLRLTADGASEAAETLWNDALRNAASEAWKQARTGLGYSARALRADAKYWPRFRALLRTLLPVAEPAIPEGDAM